MTTANSAEGNEVRNSERQTLAERMQDTYEIVNFYPHTNRELSLINSALKFPETSGGFAKYLNTVLEHQRKSNSTKPTAALDAIVDEVAGFEHDAKNARSFAFGIWDEIDDTGLDSTAMLFDAIDPDWKMQGSTLRGLKDLARRVSLDSFVIEGGDDKKIDTFDSMENIENVVATFSIVEAKRHLGDLIKEEYDRELFWKKQLSASVRHMGVGNRSR